MCRENKIRFPSLASHHSRLLLLYKYSEFPRSAVALLLNNCTFIPALLLLPTLAQSPTIISVSLTCSENRSSRRVEKKTKHPVAHYVVIIIIITTLRELAAYKATKLCSSPININIIRTFLTCDMPCTAHDLLSRALSIYNMENKTADCRRDYYVRVATAKITQGALNLNSCTLSRFILFIVGNDDDCDDNAAWANRELLCEYRYN